jgi:zinc-binding alcohol dehydrogenase/oxidoreductase
MKAAIFEELGKYPIFQEWEKPLISENQILIKLSHAALNHRDLWITKGQYAGIKTPMVLGSDGVGKLDDDSDKDYLICPSLDWGNNPNVQSSEFRVLGLPDYGTMAEYIAIDKSLVFEKPKYLTNIQAAAVPLAGLTAYRSVFTRGKLRDIPNPRVLITGAGGGASSFCIQFALAFGAEVWVTSGNQEKINFWCSQGVKEGINYKEESWAKTLKVKSGGFDLIVDSAGGPGFSSFLDLANPGGTIVFYGGTLGNINNLNPQKIFWKQLNILGSTMGTPNEFKEMLEFMESYEIQPIIDSVYPLENVEDAFKKMESGTQLGKIVLSI